MVFSEFVQKLSKSIRAGSSTAVFTKSIIEAVLTEEGLDILSEYKGVSSFKGFYNGNTSIAGLAKKINAYLEPENFVAYIHQFSDAAVQNLCNDFLNVVPDINLHNAGEKLADLFVSIIVEAAETKKSAPKGADVDFGQPMAFISEDADVAPDLSEFKDGIFYFGEMPTDDEPAKNPFSEYLQRAADYYSQKKTLLYAETPRPFYDIYVCNNVRYRKFRAAGVRDPKPEITIEDAKVSRLESESRYIIIEGTGGIGKSMFLTHLFLSSSSEYENTGEIPIFLSLKDYKENISNVVEFIWASVEVYDPEITQTHIIDALENKSLVLLMDGLDEIQSSMRDNFHTDLEAFIKSYPGNAVFISSRPVSTFVSYARFSLFDILPLEKEQAIALIEKLDFWDETAKRDFMTALNRSLFYSHYEFASNPLLLTIMLMTYSSFGEVPAKMHVFYSKAYETMARLHDATKGSFKRPLYTNLTPEDFAKCFAQFCARTYTEEQLVFDARSFFAYMERVLKKPPVDVSGIKAWDFLKDLTDNLCIMYQEGNKYYFIHRSFQEYFAALHFASVYDERLKKVGDFFEKASHCSYSDRTFAMLYDMIPEKVERCVFLPFLEKLISRCADVGASEEYWAFLEDQYPELYYEYGDVGESFVNDARSFLYRTIIREKKLSGFMDIGELSWPDELNALPRKNWVRVHRLFMDSEGYERNPDPENISEDDLEEMEITAEDEVYYRYSEYFGDPEIVGFTITIDMMDLRKNPAEYPGLHKFIESPIFPLFDEYNNVKAYYDELKTRIKQQDESDDLFDG